MNMIWKRGSDDKEMVIRIQRRLNEWGFGPVRVDNDFGEVTENAVKAFQEFHNLKVDGVIGEKTYPIIFPEDVKTPIETITENNKESIKEKDEVKKGGYSLEEIQLLLDYEVGGGEKYYNKFLKKPTWPGYESGLTILIGIDLRFHSLKDFNTDLKDIPAMYRPKLQAFLGKAPSYVKANLSYVNDVSLDWNLAYKIFTEVTIPKWERAARKAFPGFDNLPSCVRIALISLVFNRGSQINASNRRLEMKNIRDYCIPQNNIQGIADQLRQMTRIWKGSDIEKGMRARRYAEARMVEKALA